MHRPWPHLLPALKNWLQEPNRNVRSDANVLHPTGDAQPWPMVNGLNSLLAKLNRWPDALSPHQSLAAAWLGAAAAVAAQPLQPEPIAAGASGFVDHGA